MNKELESLISHISSEVLCQTCAQLDNYVEFYTCPASLGHHHAYKGGLFTHTQEVVEYCLYLSSLNLKNGVDNDILLTAALWHDLAKIWEYVYVKDFLPISDHRHLIDSDGLKVNGCWVYNKYGSEIHHINGSCAEFTAHALKFNVDRELIQKIQHAILGHHGPNRDWGSPVKPVSVEALILHQADNLSAAFGKTA